MKRILIIIVSLPLIFAYLAFHKLQAQCIPQVTRHLDVNKVDASYHNGGDMFWDLVGNPGYEVPAGSGNHSNFASALWLGGMDQNGQLHTAAQTYRQGGFDYFSGPVSATGQYDCDQEVVLPTTIAEDGLVELSNGKTLFLYQDGYSIYDDATGQLDDRITPMPRFDHQAVELASGDVLIYGDFSYPAILPSLLLDGTTFVPTTVGTPHFFHRYSTANLLTNGKVLVSGFFGSELYDPTTALYDSSISQPFILRNRHSSIRLNNGSILRVGGSEQSYFSPVATNTTDIYDPATNSWTMGPNMATGRMRPSLVNMGGGKILIIGGDDSSTEIEQYDMSTGLITTVTNLPQAIGYSSAHRMTTGEVFIMGATSSVNSNSSGISFLYRPATNDFKDSDLPRSFSVFTNTAIFNLNHFLFQNTNTSFVRYDVPNESYDWNRFQKIWKVSQAQIDQFLLDHANGTVNWEDYPDIRTWPAHGDVSKGQDFLLAPFIDLDNNGHYDPNQGEYPCIQGDQELYWIFNDDVDAHTETGGEKMGVQVKFSAYAYDCSTGNCPDSALDYTTFHHVEIVNKSGDDYSDVYLAVWSDVDLGFFADDLIGCDTSLNLAYVYNGPATDPDYGTPPASGTVILGSPDNLGMSHFGYYENDFSTQGNPTTPNHYYGYMKSLWTDGTHVVDNGLDGYSGTAAGPDINYMFPGNPTGCEGDTAGGWSMTSAMITPFDRRYIQSIGPVSFAAGDTLMLDYAIVWSQGTSNLESICKLKADVASVQAFWDAENFQCFNLTVDRAEDRVAPILGQLEIYPNPNAGNFTLRLETPLRYAATLDLYDAQGRIVGSTTLPAGSRTFDIEQSGLNRGMYIARVNGPEIEATRKLIVE